MATRQELKIRSLESLLQKQRDAAERKTKRLKKAKLLAKNKPKRESMSALKNRLWNITSRIVRLGADRCYTCSKLLPYEKRAAGHFWSKGGHGYTRFDMDNLRVQCTSCNVMKSGNLAEFGTVLRKEIGEARYDLLSFRAHSGKKLIREELERMLLYRQAELDKMQNAPF
jgi:hypothetical protein